MQRLRSCLNIRLTYIILYYKSYKIFLLDYRNVSLLLLFIMQIKIRNIITKSIETSILKVIYIKDTLKSTSIAIAIQKIIKLIFASSLSYSS